jgi:hypothetical protein
MGKPKTNDRAVPEGKLLLDDLWLNEAESVLRDIAGRCEREFGHKPTLEDFRQLLETKLCAGLEDYFADGEGVDVVKVVFKTKRKPAVQHYRVGDVFAIPLEKDLHAFGRIMRDPAFEDAGIPLVEVFRETSSRRAYQPSIAASGRLLYPTDVTAALCLKNRRWKVIASDPSYHFAEADRDLEFLVPDPHFWSAVKPFAPGAPSRCVTEDEWRRMDANGQSPGLVRPADFEDRIRKALKRAEGGPPGPSPKEPR